MPKNKTADLRRWERHPTVIPVGLVSKSDKKQSDMSSDTTDVSASGLAVRTKLGLVPKQEVTIVIKGPFSRTIPARVIWVREDKSSNSMIAGLKYNL